MGDYIKPELTEHGSVASLTLGSTASEREAKKRKNQKRIKNKRRRNRNLRRV